MPFLCPGPPEALISPVGKATVLTTESKAPRGHSWPSLCPLCPASPRPSTQSGAPLQGLCSPSPTPRAHSFTTFTNVTKSESSFLLSLFKRTAHISQLPLVGKGRAIFEVFPQISIVWPGGSGESLHQRCPDFAPLPISHLPSPQTTQLRGR